MRSLRRIILVLLLLVIGAYSLYASDLPKWFPFNEDNALKEWQEKIFKNKVMYSIAATNTPDGHLLAQSNQACSGLIYRLKLDVKQFPNMSWDWKVTRFPNKKSGNQDTTGWIEKDDYAARVYVIFSSWNFMNIKSLEYVWDETLPEEKVMSSPYFDNIKLIVAQSGRESLDAWVMENRNIYEDYKKAFGKEPPRYATAIALMTDADNTLSTAEAMYKNLKVGDKYEPR